MKKKFYVDNYLNKNQQNVINSIKEDEKELSEGDIKSFIEYEEAHDNRMILLDFLKKILGIKKEELAKMDKVEVKDEIKKTIRKVKGKMQYVILNPECPHRSVSLPKEGGGVTVNKDFFTQVPDETVDYLERRWEGLYEAISEDEYKKRLEKQNKEIEKKAKENK